MKAKGFTILELIVVISVLLILIGIAIPRIKGMQDSGNITKANAELQTLQTAMESYYSNQNPKAYPVSSTTPCATVFDTASPKIISSPLYDPFGTTNTTEYDMLVSSNGTYYMFASVGAGGTAISGSTVITPTGTCTCTSPNICKSNGTGC
jgi:prepilin-type N-terminal cleavage/methylation domain-containing protein